VVEEAGMEGGREGGREGRNGREWLAEDISRRAETGVGVGAVLEEAGWKGGREGGKGRK